MLCFLLTLCFEAPEAPSAEGICSASPDSVEDLWYTEQKCKKQQKQQIFINRYIKCQKQQHRNPVGRLLHNRETSRQHIYT